MLYNQRFSLLSGAMFVIVVFSIFLIVKSEYAYQLIEDASVTIRFYFGRYYLAIGFLSVIAIVLMAILPTGTIKLGTSEEKPEYSRLEWIAMLYSAGMGAGILLRAVQEPVYMKMHPPVVSTAAPKVTALSYVFYHWGFTAWAFYALFAAILSYYIYKYKAPIVISTAFTEAVTLLKRQRIIKPTFWLIDLLCILTTVIGLVAAVGLGTTQITGGISYLTGSPVSLYKTIFVIILISIIAGISALIGVNKGIKIISKYNIYCTLVLLFFVFVQSDRIAILYDFFKALYHYLSHFLFFSLAIGDYNPGEAFLTDWTYYYWAFWLAWAPFTGIFIARISKGRTLRELVLGVLLIPSLGTFMWFTVFGNAAFQSIEMLTTYDGRFDDVFTSIFVFFSQFPFQTFINCITILLLLSFLVTSLDSAIFVLSMFTDKGNEQPHKKHRLLWSIALALLTIGVVSLGAAKEDSNVLIAMQKLLIVTSLPFSILLIIMILLFIRSICKKKF